MKRKRRNHSPGFKAKVALAALKGDRTLAGFAQHFDVHPNQIQDWEKRMLESAEQLFENGSRSSDDADVKVKELCQVTPSLTS